MLAEHLKGKTPRFAMELRYRDGAGNWRWARQAGMTRLRRARRPGPPHGRRGGRHHRNKHLDDALVASADVLKVMSRSTFELKTVLDAVVRAARAALRGGRSAAVPPRRRQLPSRRRAGGSPASRRTSLRDKKLPPARDTMVGRTALERRVIHIPDIAADPDYDWPEVHKVTDFTHHRSVVPLLREGEPIGRDHDETLGRPAVQRAPA